MIAFNIHSIPSGLKAVPERFRPRLIEWFCGPDADADYFNARFKVGYTHSGPVACVALIANRPGTRVGDWDESRPYLPNRIDIIRLFAVGDRVTVSRDGYIGAEVIQ